MPETIVPNIRNTETKTRCVLICSLVQAFLLYVVRNLRKISGFIYSPIHMLVQLYRGMLRFSCKVFYYESNILLFLVQSHLWLLSSTDRYLIPGQYKTSQIYIRFHLASFLCQLHGKIKLTKLCSWETSHKMTIEKK